MNYTTEQEKFWAGDFGDNYISRNSDEKILASNLALFGKILSDTEPIRSVLELGANIGLNLQAIKSLLPASELSAVEINAKAVEQLNNIEGIRVFHESILNFESSKTYEFVLLRVF